MRTSFQANLQRSWVAVAVGVVGAGVSVYKGIKQKNDAKKKLAALDGKEIPEEILENKKIAQGLANQGLPSEQYAIAQKNIGRKSRQCISIFTYQVCR